jgi:CRP-like cAMP-binding protein
MTVRHRVFSVAATLTVNFFYLFSGKPVLRLFPEPIEELSQMAVATASTIWLIKSWRRSRTQYNRESLTKVLLRQLKSLALDFSKLLDGRSLEELKPDEVYVLAKVLPGVSKDDKLGVYKGIVREALATAKTHSSESLGVLRDVRQQLGVTDSQHSEILLELGVENPALLDPDYRMSEENYVRLSGYRENVMALLMEAMRDRHSPVADAIEQKQAELARLRAAYNVSESEHQDVIDGIVRQEDVLVLLCNEGLESLVALVARHHALLNLPHDPDGGFASLLRAILHKQRAVLVAELLHMVTTIQSRDEQVALAESLRSLDGDILDELLSAAARGVVSPSGWEARMPPEVRSALEDKHAPTIVRGRSLIARRFSYRDVVERAVSATDALEHIILHGDSCPAAIALAALAEENRPQARRLAAQLLEGQGDRHWLLRETVETITGVRPAATASFASSGTAYTVFQSETVSRLVWFSSIPMFHRLDLEILADLARDAEVRWYGKDAEVCRQGDPSEELYVLHKGTAHALLNAFGEEKMIEAIGPGRVIGELGVLTLSERAITVRVTSNHAIILVLSASRLHQLMDQDAYVTKWMLLTVCERLQDALSRGQVAESAPA